MNFCLFLYDLRPKPLCGFAASAMTLGVAINGFDLIGSNVRRGWISRGADTGREIVGMNSTCLLYTSDAADE